MLLVSFNWNLLGWHKHGLKPRCQPQASKHARLIWYRRGHFKIQHARFMPAVNRAIVLKNVFCWQKTQEPHDRGETADKPWKDLELVWKNLEMSCKDPDLSRTLPRKKSLSALHTLPFICVPTLWELEAQKDNMSFVYFCSSASAINASWWGKHGKTQAWAHSLALFCVW